ncbi:ribonuclease H [Senna tora]|uniref:Ribonuclease H n=1 Tax=Senna tora TaxID=362788 RepID=A0A834XGH9_9FABA|nr:ribonuclease H [Senna tora]
MTCISSPKLNVIWNGERIEDFQPSRGLRQGDPLSPYIFVLCMDILSHIICNAVNNGSWKGVKAGKDNMHVSHLMFADDLLLFGSATVNQARCFKRSQEVGKYLGAEIIHGRKTRVKFNHIVDKIQNRLAGWKANCLSFAGRATLVQSVCASMPLYHMQNCLLPKSVINQIEMLERAFLWESSAEKKRCHQIGWNKICIPKSLGGLGILSLSEMNLAFFYKLAWQLLTRNDSLWVKFIKGKYGVLDNRIFETRSKPTYSSFWRDLIRILPDLRSQIAWEMGDGRRISFWEDRWVSNNVVLSQYVDPRRPILVKEVKVREFITDQGHWDMGKLMNALPRAAIDKILDVSPPGFYTDSDNPLWNRGKDNHFTTKSAYLSIRNLENNNGNSVWNSIWKGNNQQRHKVLLWRLCHNSLPTRSRTATWSGASSTCPLCQHSRESNLHTFRDCSVVTRIWNCFINRKDRPLFYLLPLREWILWNTQRKVKFSNIPWSNMFAIICNCLWNWRNKVVNEADFNYPNEPHRLILNIAKNQLSAWNTSFAPSHQCGSSKDSKWKKPEDGWVKVNTDGAVCRESSLGGCGGIIRDTNGDWIKGFSLKLGLANPLSAEFWSIAEGLKLAWQLGFNKVILENDSLDAINCFKNGPNMVDGGHPAVKLWRTCCAKTGRFSLSISLGQPIRVRISLPKVVCLALVGL